MMFARCFHIIGNLETMHDWYLHTFSMRAQDSEGRQHQLGADHDGYSGGLQQRPPGHGRSFPYYCLFPDHIGTLETMHDWY